MPVTHSTSRTAVYLVIPVLVVGVAELAAQAPAAVVPDASSSASVVQAVRTERPPEIDGVLDEPFWQAIPPITGFA